MGVGQVLSDPQYGIRAAASLIALEGLASVGRDGKPKALLAKSWTVDNGGHRVRIHLRPSVTFHDGTPVTAETIRSSLERSLKNSLGEAATNIESIRSPSNLELEINLKERSNFVTEALDSPISSPSAPNVGTGPFYISAADKSGIEMRANRSYYLGAPLIDNIQLKPYDSFRSAWADMLRGRLDMLYEVGLEGLESLKPASTVRVFTYRRNYAYLLVFNMRDGQFKSAHLRRGLSEAVDRAQIVNDGLAGHGAAADEPVWPEHWANVPGASRFRYDPVLAVSDITASQPVRRTFRCAFPAAQPYERLALVLQRQLRAVGVDVVLEPLPNDQFIARITAGNFETMLTDVQIAMTILQQYQWWHSNGPRNFSRFSSSAIDAALDAIDRAPDEKSYQTSVATFRKAIVDDPPAIFLAWGERARAVSTRFEVPSGTSLETLRAIRLFRPVIEER
jgi:peptide/nickel transport system substrate-binding protein